MGSIVWMEVFYCSVSIIFLVLTPAIGYLTFDLDDDEQAQQIPLYNGSSSKELIDTCRDPNNGKYNFKHDDCVANKIELDKTDPRYELLKKERQKLLEEAISKASGFKFRLSWPPIQFIFQLFAFLVCLGCGLFLWVVGHFDMRSHYVPFFKDPTKGVPGKVFLAKENNFWIHYWPPPNPEDPDYDTFLFEESEGWSTVDEEIDETPKPKMPEQVPGEPPVEMSPEELEFIRKNAEFDEYGYPFEYKYVDKEEDDFLLDEFDKHIEAANAAIVAEAAAKKLPYWRAARQAQDKAALLLDDFKDIPGFGLMNMRDPRMSEDPTELKKIIHHEEEVEEETFQNLLRKKTVTVVSDTDIKM